MRLAFRDSSGFDLTIAALYVTPLYGGALVMPVHADIMDRAAQYAYEAFEAQVRDLWGADRPRQLLGDHLLAGPNNRPKRLQKAMRAYVGAAWLVCPKTVRDDDAHGSQCVVMWTQGPKEAAFPKRIRNKIRWERMARDYRF
jgi:hypothetical protein